MEKPVIQVKNLYKIYRIGENKVKALNGVDFSISRGEFCCIVGTSGSGKSTLLNMMAGLEPPTRGEIIIAGEHIEKKNEAKLVVFRQEHVGFIFQSYNLMPNLTAVENVMLSQYYHSVPDEKEALEALERVGLKDRAKHYPSQLSGGEQQRVCVARALINYPEIILADEPTGNLDEANEEIVVELFRKLHEDGTTLVVVTHNPEVAEVAQRTVVLRNGKVDHEQINPNFTGKIKHITLQ